MDQIRYAAVLVGLYGLIWLLLVQTKELGGHPSWAGTAVAPGWVRFVVYASILPMILLQAAGVRRPIKSERSAGLPFGAAVGVLANRRMRQTTEAAIDALGARATRQAVWRFSWDWWYQRSVDELIALQRGWGADCAPSNQASVWR